MNVTPSYRSLRAGACWALPSCVQGLPGLDSQRAEGGISDAAFGVVGGRCVLSTGVRLDSPTGGGLVGAVAVRHTSPPL